MQLKDYYKTLGVAPVATTLQIKKSFRQLALRHHPDKNPGNAVAEAKFREIQEAYEILSDPEKREEYNYKRWYSRSLKQTFSNEPVTPASILAECNRLNDYMLTVNTLRVDFDGLSYHIRQILGETNIAMLQQAGEKTIRSKVIEKIIRCGGVLPFKYVEPIALLLLRIAGDDRQLVNQIQLFIKQQKQQTFWHKYRPAFVVAATILLCIVIYFISR